MEVVATTAVSVEKVNVDSGGGERHTWHFIFVFVSCVLCFIFCVLQFLFVFVSVEKNFVDTRVGEHRTLVFCCLWTQGLVSLAAYSGILLLIICLLMIWSQYGSEQNTGQCLTMSGFCCL